MMKPVTIKDVARRANVGIGTVSRVLNNHPSVKEKTRISVLRVIEELDYKPNAIARSLKVNKTKSIGIMIPDISSLFFPDIVRGIEDVASKYDYHIILCSNDLDRKKEKVSLNMLKEKKVDGIIFISNTVDEDLKREFKKIQIPIVLVATKDNENDFPYVTIDNRKAAFEATDYLCRLGHKDIIMIAGKRDDPNAGIPRVEGFMEALKNHGLSTTEERVYYGDYTYKSGYDIMMKILQSKNIPSAVFAASDTMAVGAGSVILKAGYHIPRDISLIGFDGIDVTEFFYPPISTVKQPRYEMGARGMELLIDRMNNKTTAKKEVLLDYEIVLRRSCQTVRKGDV